jgi:hypothetical protein
MTYTSTFTHQYLSIVNKHVVEPLENTDVSEHCFAAALLIFSSIDGLGMLTCSDSDKAYVGTRFRYYIETYMPPQYKHNKYALYKLRCSLSHSALNTACFMSKTDEAQGQHLEIYNGYIFIHTPTLLTDFKSSLMKLESTLQNNPAILSAAESRFNSHYIPPGEWRNSREIRSTPPPGISFIELKK